MPFGLFGAVGTEAAILAKASDAVRAKGETEGFRALIDRSLRP